MNVKGSLFLLFLLLINWMRLEGQEIRGCIISVENGEVNIDLTQRQIRVGDQLKVVAHEGFKTDPVTKRRIKINKELGTLVVSRAYVDYSVATPSEELLLSQLKPGMTVLLSNRKSNTSEYVSKNTKQSLTNQQIVSKNSGSEANIINTYNKGFDYLKFQDDADISSSFSSSQKSRSTMNVKKNKWGKLIDGKGALLYVVSEIPDSIFPYSYVSDLNRHIRSKKHFGTATNIQDAELILCFRGYNVMVENEVTFKSYALVFDNKWNFLYRTETYKLASGIDTPSNLKVKSFTSKILDDIKLATIWKRKNNKLSKKISQTEFDKYYLRGMKNLDIFEYRKAQDDFLKCIELDPSQWQLYKTIAYCCIERKNYSAAIRYYNTYIDYNPTDGSIDQVYGIVAGNRIVRRHNNLRTFALVTALVGVVTTTAANAYAASQGIDISNTSYGLPTNYSNGYSSGSSISRVKEEKCSYCNGTGISPIATHSVSFAGGGEEWCEHCHKYVASGHGYHGQCPSCAGKGTVMRIR